MGRGGGGGGKRMWYEAKPEIYSLVERCEALPRWVSISVLGGIMAGCFCRHGGNGSSNALDKWLLSFIDGSLEDRQLHCGMEMCCISSCMELLCCVVSISDPALFVILLFASSCNVILISSSISIRQQAFISYPIRFWAFRRLSHIHRHKWRSLNNT